MRLVPRDETDSTTVMVAMEMVSYGGTKYSDVFNRCVGERVRKVKS